MIRIRYLLLVLFGVLALIPVAVFGLWSSADVLRNEFDSVKDRHLLLARNLSSTLDRYQHDLVSVFELMTNNLATNHPIGNVDELLSNLHIQNICIANHGVNSVQSASVILGGGCPQSFNAEQMALFNSALTETGSNFTSVVEGENGEGNVIYLVRRLGGNISVATISTQYFVELGQSISFGVKGHAAIVDHLGNVLAHPLPEWVAGRHNIADVSAVQRIFDGETGIEQFYSSALEADMIAGFATVSGPGWGVMVPQPVAELYQKASGSQQTAMLILFASVSVAAGLSLFISIRLSRPLERVISAFSDGDDEHSLTELNVEYGTLVPNELIKLQESFNSMVRSINQGQARIRRLAYTDTVTALPNRQSFELIATRQIEHLAATGGHGAMFMIDVDEFKTINDTLGHDTGDQVLRALADRLAYAVEQATGMKSINRHPEDQTAEDLMKRAVIGRVGGDEFTIFVPNMDEYVTIDRVLKLLQTELSKPLSNMGSQLQTGEFKGGASVGAACFPEHAEDYDALVKLADIAMYHAKRGGKNRSEIFRSEIGEVTAAEMRRDVSRALQADELVLHYQPKVNGESGKVASVEALVRWNHPERGLLGPGVFVPMIEDTDVAIELGEWVVYQASEQAKAWEKNGISLRIAVNIASRHFSSAGFAERVAEIVKAAGVEPKQIELEITEETVLSSMNMAQSIIEELQGAGFHISLDDFGRGYSNLTRLANLKVDVIKIDGPLTAGITTDERTRVIVDSTINMAHGLGCITVAEGVETLEQASLLRMMGCEELQGYYFARPMEADLLTVWLNDRSSNEVLNMQEQLTKQIVERREA